MRHTPLPPAFRFLLLLLLLPLWGCAMGNQHRYHDVTAELAYAGSGDVAIAVADQRQYVVSGDKGPQFVGLSRGGFGNAFQITTASGKPLADDIAAAIGLSLAAKGFQPRAIACAPGTGEDAATDLLRTAGAAHGLLVVLREWKSDTYVNTALDYDVTLRVFGASGQRLAEASCSGKDDLGGSAWNPPSHARSAVPKAFRQKLELLLGDAAVAAALR